MLILFLETTILYCDNVIGNNSTLITDKETEGAEA